MESTNYVGIQLLETLGIYYAVNWFGSHHTVLYFSII